MSALTDGTGAITVNVGGTVYMTTLATLTRVEGSMIGALAEALSDDEVLFIDRDGPSFRYVLNYLRDPFPKPLLPGTGAEREQLAREADFYGLPGLLSRPSTNGWDGESACTQPYLYKRPFSASQIIALYPEHLVNHDWWPRRPQTPTASPYL